MIRTKRSVMSRRVGWGHTLGCLLVFAGVARAATMHIPGNFSSIQACIDVATNGDECVVAPGTYNELINFHGKAITLRSSGGPDVTIIDAGPMPDPGTGKPVVRCDTGEGSYTVLEGFMITGGSGSSTSCISSCGGGMFNSGASPTVTGCIFTANTAFYGGGMFNRDNGAVVTNCAFLNNSNVGSGYGGGMYNSQSDPTVSECFFSGNSSNSGDGGGMYNGTGHPVVTNCVFTGNSASLGGGIQNHGNHLSSVPSCKPTVTNCVFNDNLAAVGGGMLNEYCQSIVTNCTFNRNTANFLSGGGGIFDSSGISAVANCSFVANSSRGSGGGIYNNSGSMTMTNCSFVGNEAVRGGGGVFTDGGSSKAANCVLWDNAPDQVDGFIEEHPTIVRYSDVQGGWVGAGNIDIAPLFVRDPFDGGDGWGDDPNTFEVDEGANDDFGDLRLSPGSPGINTGSNAELPPDVADLDGDGDTVEPIPLDLDRHARILCGLVDMGAYEFGIGDDDCDQDVDLIDFGSYSMCITGPTVNSPLECEPFDFNGDSHIDLADWVGFQVTFTGLP